MSSIEIKKSIQQKFFTFYEFLGPETDIMVQFLDPETDVMVQFLAPEIMIMGERNYICWSGVEGNISANKESEW
jgi:hypothetical protein